MAMHAIDGIPKNCQILHVEQEVSGDDITALQCVLTSDVERLRLLEEEARLLSLQVDAFPFHLFIFLSHVFDLLHDFIDIIIIS